MKYLKMLLGVALAIGMFVNYAETLLVIAVFIGIWVVVKLI